MDKPGAFEVSEGYAVFRPTGEASLDQATQWVTAAITFAREKDLRKLLVDMTGLVSLEPPGAGTRYFAVHDWADAARGVVSVAVVAMPEMIHPEQFGVITAANVRFVARVFASESQALAWLAAL